MHADPSVLIGKTIFLEGHFTRPVTVEQVRSLGSSAVLLVRTFDGRLEEVALSDDELVHILAVLPVQAPASRLVPPGDLFLLLESWRIRLAYAYDPYFAVSLSGIRPLPHQLEAVYGKMLPQPRLRFLLADDPGAGKTVMAGLLFKELKMRGVVERVLIIVPAALTIQWQDELLRFFGEYFVVINAENDKWQLGNLWQKESQVITSMDYAKRPEVRERVWAADWDLIIVDEAHKCSAYTKHSSQRGPEAEKTERYQLVERFSHQPALSLLLLTATPHQGDEDRFAHFLHLLDPDLFPEPHRLREKGGEIRRAILGMGASCPWMVRRLKEDLHDFQGRRLFPDRHSHTVLFTLGPEEYSLYEATTRYLNRFLVGGTGRARRSIALTRTVLQRRLASSTYAIYRSLQRRLERQEKLLEELEALLPAEQRRRLLQIAGRTVDAERDEDDLDEQERDALVDETTAAEHLGELREEIAALRDLVDHAEAVYRNAPDSKLKRLREVLLEAQFAELRDGRGKLLIFTEHRDTMEYLKEHLGQWRYAVCAIHGGMNPHERKRAQEVFRTDAQVCVATEAAGEGINLQFCHLMINYDLPWNPARLEQRMGRIHRIGQQRDVYVFNFVAESALDGRPIIEGRILRKLLDKLEQMRRALGSDRVYDVVGQVLALNGVDLAEMLREAALYPGRLADYVDRIERITPEKLREYEEKTGIALARAYVDLPAAQEHLLMAEERRLMPEYVARHFLAAAGRIGLRVEKRADELWRVPHVPQDLRSEELEAVRRFGKPEQEYRKITFYKEHLEQDRHLDAVLVSPGHPLYAAVDEKIRRRLEGLAGGLATCQDPDAVSPYLLHFFEIRLVGDYPSPNTVLHAELVAIREQDGRFEETPPECLHDLAPYTGETPDLPPVDPRRVEDFVRTTVQLSRRSKALWENTRQWEIVRSSLERSFEARILAAQRHAMSLRARYEEGQKEVELALREAEKEVESLERMRDQKLSSLDGLRVVRAGPVRHLGTLYVMPAGPSEETALWPTPEEARESERLAMAYVMEYERGRGWEPEDVSAQNIGFDIRSLGPMDPQTGTREVRRIEVKGRKRGTPVPLTENEWRKARQLGDTYWLYVVWNPRGPDRELVCIRNPAARLERWAREVRTVSRYEIPAHAIERASREAGKLHEGGEA
jgi:superfamily II DNA or RNA helicase